MLQRTFRHIPGIGQTTEQRLWQMGIVDWDGLSANGPIIPRVNPAEIEALLQASRAALNNDDPSFFTSRLPGHEAWRLFPQFRHRTAFIDIETTGLGDGCEITTIALYDGRTVKAYVNGRNLEAFPDDVAAYSVLVSYNGRSFDIPFIERFFRIRLTQAQIDLRYVLSHLGCRGGLKGCERQFGINRGLLDGIDGAAAIPLWYEYDRYGNENALETLLAYNIEDTVNLERLMVEAYNRYLDLTPFSSDGPLPFPRPPQLLHHPDPILVERLRRQWP